MQFHRSRFAGEDDPVPTVHKLPAALRIRLLEVLSWLRRRELGDAEMPRQTQSPRDTGGNWLRLLPMVPDMGNAEFLCSVRDSVPSTHCIIERIDAD